MVDQKQEVASSGQLRLLSVAGVFVVFAMLLFFQPSVALIYLGWMAAAFGLLKSFVGQSFSIDEGERHQGNSGYISLPLALGMLTSLFAVIAIFAPNALSILGGLLVIALIVFAVISALRS